MGVRLELPSRGKQEPERSRNSTLLVLGPGDADLITLRGLKTIEDADLIVCSKRAQEKFAPYLEGKELLDSGS